MMVNIVLPPDLVAVISSRGCLPVVGWGHPDFAEISYKSFLQHRMLTNDHEIGADRREAQEAAIDFLRVMRPRLYPLYQTISKMGVDTILSLTPDPLLEGLLQIEEPEYATLYPSQFSIRSTYRVLVAMAGDLRHPDTMVLSDSDYQDLRRKQPAQWEMVERRAARAPFFVLGCDPGDRAILRLLSRLRPVPDFPLAGWIACRSVGRVDRARWESVGFRVIEIEPGVLIRQVAEAGSTIIAEPRRSVREQGSKASPYKYLDYFERSDGEIFFGRDVEAAALMDTVSTHRLVVVTGPSGAGKTSLINAGVLAWTDTAPQQLGIYARCGDDPIREIIKAAFSQANIAFPETTDSESLASALGYIRRVSQAVPLIVLDQAEELFTRLGGNLRVALAVSLRECILSVPIVARFVIVLRDDYLAHLVEIRDTIPNLLSNTFYVTELNQSAALQAILKPAQRFGILFEESTALQIINEVGLDRIAPPQIQLICSRLVEARPSGPINKELYDELGGAKEILTTYLADELNKAGSAVSEFREVLKAMVTSEGTKDVLDVADVTRRTSLTRERVETLLLHLRDRSRLLRSVQQGPSPRFELAHEYLTGEIWSWMTPADIAKRRVEELITREKTSWQRFKHLRLGADRLRLLEENRGLVSTDEEGLLLILLSAIRHRRPTGDWTDRVSKLSEPRRDRVVTELFEYFYVRDLRQRRDAAEVMSLLNLAPIVQALSSSDPKCRRVAIEIIGGAEYQQAREQVIHCLVSDDDEDVRALACGALGELREKSAARYLIKAIKGDTRAVMAAAIAALGKVGSKSGIPYIARALSSAETDLAEAGRNAVRGMESSELIKGLLGGSDLSASGRAAFWDAVAGESQRFTPKAVELLSILDGENWHLAADFFEKYAVLREFELRVIKTRTSEQKRWVKEQIRLAKKKETVRDRARLATNRLLSQKDGYKKIPALVLTDDYEKRVGVEDTLAEFIARDEDLSPITELLSYHRSDVRAIALSAIYKASRELGDTFKRKVIVGLNRFAVV
jgi:hypothetical protein